MIPRQGQKGPEPYLHRHYLRKADVENHGLFLHRFVASDDGQTATFEVESVYTGSIADYAQQLRSRGIDMVLVGVPAPGLITSAPEFYANPSEREALIAELIQNGRAQRARLVDGGVELAWDDLMAHVTDPIDREMVRSINEIGHLTGKMTIAEFAENAEIIQMLTSLGVDYAQGWGIAQPQRVLKAVNS